MNKHLILIIICALLSSSAFSQDTKVTNKKEITSINTYDIEDGVVIEEKTIVKNSSGTDKEQDGTVTVNKKTTTIKTVNTGDGVVVENDVKTETYTGKKEEERSSVIYDGSAYGFSFGWKRKHNKVHLPGLSFTFANMKGLDDIPHADLKEPRSYSIAFSLGDYTVGLAEHFALGMGLRLDFTRYHFKGNAGLKEVQTYDVIGNPIGKTFTTFEQDWADRQYKSSKLIVYYIAVPVVLEYHTKINRRKSFFINAGMEGLIKYYSKSQIDVKEIGGVHKETLGKDLNMPVLNARFVFNIGFNGCGLTAYYQPFSLFKKNRGEELYPWGIGLAVGF